MLWWHRERGFIRLTKQIKINYFKVAVLLFLFRLCLLLRGGAFSVVENAFSDVRPCLTPRPKGKYSQNFARR
jgi:hypothetical protein